MLKNEISMKNIEVIQSIIQNPNDSLIIYFEDPSTKPAGSKTDENVTDREEVFMSNVFNKYTGISPVVGDPPQPPPQE